MISNSEILTAIRSFITQGIDPNDSMAKSSTFYRAMEEEINGLRKGNK